MWNNMAQGGCMNNQSNCCKKSCNENCVKKEIKCCEKTVSCDSNMHGQMMGQNKYWM